MGMTKCPDCGNPIGTSADKCPHCGSTKPGTKNVLFGCFGLIALLGLIVWGVNSYLSSGPTNTNSEVSNAPSSDQDQSLPAPKKYPPIVTDLPDPSSPILVDDASLGAFAESFGMEPQNDNSSDNPRIYAPSSSIDEQGKHSYSRPSIMAFFSSDMPHLKIVCIFVNGPAGWHKTPESDLEFTISSLDWHNNIMAGLIRLCCGQKVLDGLTVQIDKYLAAYGDYNTGIGMEFTEGGFTFSYDFCRGYEIPAFGLTISGSGEQK